MHLRAACRAGGLIKVKDVPPPPYLAGVDTGVISG